MPGNGAKESEDKTDLVVEEPLEEVVYKRRWFVLVIFIGSNILIGFNSVCFGQMNTEYAMLFNVTSQTVDWLTLGNAVGEMTTCFIIAVFTLWKVIHFRWWSILMTTGAVICYILVICSVWFQANIVVAIVGQMFMGFSSGILESVMSLAAAIWFAEHQLATALGAIWVGETIGFAFGSLVPDVVITDQNYVELSHGERENSRRSITIMFTVMLSVAIVLFLLTFIFMENKPPKPPSKSAARRFYTPQPLAKCDCKSIGNNALDFVAFMKSVFTNFTSVALTISFSIAYTLTTLQFMFTSELVEMTDENVTTEDNIERSSYIMLALCIGCMVGGLVGGWALDKWKQYRLFMIISSFGALLTAIPVIAGSIGNTDIIIYAGNLCHGFFIIALLTIVNDSALQHMYPAEEMAVGTWLIFSGNVATSFIPLGSRALLDSTGYIGFFSYYVFFLVLCVIFSCTLKIHHIRLDINDHLTENEKLCKK